MNRRIYDTYLLTEERHWWFRARRAILHKILLGLILPANAGILEVGCGTGGNLKLLARHGFVKAFEMDEKCAQQAADRGIGTVRAGFLPDCNPFLGEQFDLIVFLDVLEHIEGDSAALIAAKRMLKPGGKLLITVPALPWLWSQHDVEHHHFRRYERIQLGELLQSCGYTVSSVRYFNGLLFPLAWVQRKFLNKKENSSVHTRIPPTLINELFRIIFALERHVLPFCGLPIGVSLIAIASHDQELIVPLVLL